MVSVASSARLPVDNVLWISVANNVMESSFVLRTAPLLPIWRTTQVWYFVESFAVESKMRITLES